MADPICAALERLQEYAVAHPEHDTGELVAAAFAALAAEPPAPAPALLPLDLDALLSPEGAYEPGTGQEDGAQLVDQLQWWAPMHGCETLENLLDRIRRRILPHLRPPIAGIDVPGTDGDYGGLQELCDAEGVDVRIGAPLLKRAREAWGAAQPPAPASADLIPDAGNMVALGWEPEACLLSNMTASQLARAAALLRQSAPALVLVPVAERPWEQPGWCDAEGRCCWLAPNQSWPCLYLMKVDSALAARVATHCLPHWFIPIPIPQPPQGGEVRQ